MVAPMFAEQEQAVRSAYAEGLGAHGNAFAAGEVVVAARPDQHWGYQVVGAAFADATLFSAAPEWIDLVRAKAPDAHSHRAMLQVLSWVRDEASRRGRSLTLHAPAICWALATVPEKPELPSDLRCELVDADWMNAQIPGGRFENGAGELAGVDGRQHRNLYGVVLRDPGGEVVALAGAFATYGLHEVGVDVVPERQGEGLGRAVVAALVREILDRGATPFYGCNPTNIRSIRTALAAGFVPISADTSITA